MMNFDCAHACIDAEHAVQPKMKLLSNHGFARFNAALTRSVAVTDLRVDHANMTTATIGWRSPAAAR